MLWEHSLFKADSLTWFCPEDFSERSMESFTHWSERNMSWSILFVLNCSITIISCHFDNGFRFIWSFVVLYWRRGKKKKKGGGGRGKKRGSEVRFQLEECIHLYFAWTAILQNCVVYILQSFFMSIVQVGPSCQKTASHEQHVHFPSQSPRNPLAVFLCSQLSAISQVVMTGRRKKKS